MDARTYTITASSFTGSLIFKYDFKGFLTAFKIDGELSDVQKDWLYGHRFPFMEVGMDRFKKLKEFTVIVGELDLSFENFWNIYAYKTGKKPMAENIWKRLSEADKIKAITGVKAYDGYLSRKPGLDKAHATTYLNQRYYENDHNKY